MTRLLFALALGILAVGCTGIQPVGPFAKMGAPPGKKGAGKDGKDKDEPPEPIMVPAVRPTPPMNTVGPEDVTSENPHLVVQKMQRELEADNKTIPNAPVTAEISRIKGGVKQN